MEISIKIPYRKLKLRISFEEIKVPVKNNDSAAAIRQQEIINSVEKDIQIQKDSFLLFK